MHISIGLFPCKTFVFLNQTIHCSDLYDWISRRNALNHSTFFFFFKSNNKHTQNTINTKHILLYDKRFDWHTFYKFSKMRWSFFFVFYFLLLLLDDKTTKNRTGINIWKLVTNIRKTVLNNKTKTNERTHFAKHFHCWNGTKQK